MNKFLEENEVYDYQIIDGKYFIGKCFISQVKH